MTGFCDCAVLISFTRLCLYSLSRNKSFCAWRPGFSSFSPGVKSEEWPPRETPLLVSFHLSAGTRKRHPSYAPCHLPRRQSIDRTTWKDAQPEALKAISRYEVRAFRERAVNPDPYRRIDSRQQGHKVVELGTTHQQVTRFDVWSQTWTSLTTRNLVNYMISLKYSVNKIKRTGYVKD